MPPGDTGDELTLMPDGRVRIILEGKGWTLRVCRVGTLRKLKELWAGVQLTQEAERERRQAEAREAYTEEHHKPPPENWEPEFGAEATNEYDLFLRETVADWALEVFRLLCPAKDPPARDDLPAWMANTFYAQKLFGHWLNVPLAPSSQ